MKRNNFFVLIASATILISMVSCKKETFDTNNNGSSNGNQNGNTGKTNIVNANCSNWIYDGNGKFSSKLDGILNQINIPQSGVNEIGIFLVEQGRDLPITTGFKYRLGVVWSEINKNDVTVFYQSDDRTAYLPFASISVKIVSQ